MCNRALLSILMIISVKFSLKNGVYHKMLFSHLETFKQFFTCVFASQCYFSTKKINTSTRGQVTKYHLVQPIIFSKVRPIIMRRILCIIKRRQDGKCHFCNLLFSKKDVLVSCGYRRNYYHKSCARKLHII
jgi:hypothetical protein